MDSSVSAKDEIWFLRVCHHFSNAVYLRRTGNDSPRPVTVVLRLWGLKPVPTIHESSWLFVFSASPKNGILSLVQHPRLISVLDESFLFLFLPTPHFFPRNSASVPVTVFGCNVNLIQFEKEMVTASYSTTFFWIHYPPRDIFPIIWKGNCVPKLVLRHLQCIHCFRCSSCLGWVAENISPAAHCGRQGSIPL